MAIKLEFTVETCSCLGVPLGRTALGSGAGKEEKLGTVGWGFGQSQQDTPQRVTQRLREQVLSQ